MDAASSCKDRQTLGFLTVVEHSQYGLFGGYLILNTAGRPLEFHCTAPIKPNRAQEILYGPTLESFLYGEQIGQTLISQGSALPLLVCTDREPALAAREHVSPPVVLVLPSDVGGDCPDFCVSKNGTVALTPRASPWKRRRTSSFGSMGPIAAARDLSRSSFGAIAWPCLSGRTKIGG